MKRIASAATHLLALLALPWLASGAASAQEPDPLPARQAYKYTATIAGDEVVVRYQIAKGYYLYRDRMSLGSTTPGVTIGTARMPAGEDHDDEYFGKQVIYRGPITVASKVTFDGEPRAFDLQLKLQGCADAGLCYPPQTWTTRVEIPGAAAQTGADAGGKAAPTANSAPASDSRPAGAATAAADAGTSPPVAPGGGFNLKRLFGGGPLSESDLLHVDQAFVLSASSDSPDRITLHWDIADGYYLYRDKVKVAVASGDAQLGTPVIPGGEVKHDEYFGDQVVFTGQMEADVPVAAAAGSRAISLEVVYQGCAEAGLCYPPTHKTVQVQLAAPGAAPAPRDRTVAGAGPMRSTQDALADKIRSGSLLAVLATFFGAGLLLAFTPCVLPMVPILSGIIVGAGRDRPVSRGRAFSLSMAYVLGMALTYTVAGAAFAAAGRQAQAFFQQPWIIAVFAGLFVLLALGMFGVFNLQVPAAFQERVTGLSNRQKQGTLVGTAVMGALSSLIVTACVAPPLVAALAVIGQSGNVFRGGAALFALSLGMGAPLLLVGASAGRLLPKAGAWMDAVKSAFGVMMLGVAIWMLGRILPGPVTLALWAALAFVSGYCLLTMGDKDARRAAVAVRRGFGVLALVYGVLMLVGALAGRSDPLQPLAGVVGHTGGEAAEHRLALKRIKSVADFERELAAAQAAGRPLMLDFYADWCVSCREMEDQTFTDPDVQAVLAKAVLLQADVTANDDEDQALLEHFGILGPPTIVFFAAEGAERKDFRVVGFQPASEFRGHAARALGGERHMRPLAVAALVIGTMAAGAAAYLAFEQRARPPAARVGAGGVAARRAECDRVAALGARRTGAGLQAGRPGRNTALAGRLAGQVADRELLGHVVCSLPARDPAARRAAAAVRARRLPGDRHCGGLPGQGHRVRRRGRDQVPAADRRTGGPRHRRGIRRRSRRFSLHGVLGQPGPGHRLPRRRVDPAAGRGHPRRDRTGQ